MNELLKKVNRHNFLKLGDYKFSPLMELSSGIALEYCKKFDNNKCDKFPLFLCFPEKQSASLWTAICILTNYYFADYINNEVDGISFIRGQKVKIFNCIGEIERISKNKIFLKFRDQGGIPINNKLRGQLSPVPKTRSLSLKKRFGINYKKYKTNRNPISKILEPNEPNIVNQNNLDSKVLLIAGRGNVKKLKKRLNELEIYDTPLVKIYPENKNLIIKSDLKRYKGYFDKKEMDKRSVFKSSIIKLYKIINIEKAKDELEKIIDELQGNDEISNDLDEQIESFFQDYEDELPGKIKFLKNKYPGIKESLPKKLRAVVINDIDQIYEYPETIAGFLNKGIPVIFMTNRYVSNNFDLDLYQKLFKSNPDYFRFNWNKGKVQELIDFTDESEFIDQDLWSTSKRYANQTININVFEGSELDLIAPLLLSYIKDLNEFELLQNAFYNYFYPALYSLKNSQTSSNITEDLIKKFNEVFLSVKSGLRQDVANSFIKAISLAEDFQNNTKPIKKNGSVFAQLLPIKSDKDFFIPTEAIRMNIPKPNTDKIIFTGYPYSEYSGKHLLNACCLYFVPQLEILCWPNEASLTYNYLYRRIKAGYFTDNIEDVVCTKSSNLLKNKNDFEQEIDRYFTKDKFNSDEEQEELLEFIHTFKYKAYGLKKNDNSMFPVKCDILNFADESFMFLPHRSKILAQTEDENGNLKISKRAISELNVGDTVFKYIKDRHTMRDIAKSKKIMSDHFDQLELWKNILEALYIKCNNSIDELKLLLDKTKVENNLLKGNPSKSSLRNWLFDDEFLKPENDNLKIILLANSENNIEEKIKQLEISYQNVVSFTISLSSKIKKQIAKQLSSKPINDLDLNVKIEGNPILIHARNIVSIEANNIEVDYRNTRKILC